MKSRQWEKLDADKLKTTKGMFIYQTEDADVIATEAYRWELIEREAPTVKAIPIEWLNKRAEEIAFAYWTNARNKMTLPLNELPLLIDQIIGEWEKENEPNKKNTSQID